LMATTSTTMPISRASGGTSTSRSISGAVAPLSYIEAQEEREALSVDSQRAISLANESPGFQARIAGASYQFNSIYEEVSWCLKTANPSVVIDTVNVVYSHLDVDGAGTNIVATEDSGLTK